MNSEALKTTDLYETPEKHKGKGKDLETKNTVYTGPITNAFMHSSDDIGTIQKADSYKGDENEYRTITMNGVYFYKEGELFNSPLTPVAQRLFLFNLSKLAQNTNKGETNINKIREANFKPFSLKEYMDECGLNDRKEAIKNIKRSLKELITTRVSYTVETFIGEGKTREKKRFAQNSDILTLAIDTTESAEDTEKRDEADTCKNYIDHCIEKGLVYMSFDTDLAIHLVNSPLLALPHQLFKLDIHRNGHAQSLAFYLINMANQNHKKLSVIKMLESCPDIPVRRLLNNNTFVNISNQRITNEPIRIYKNIIEPFEKALCEIKEKGILKEYKLTDNEGRELKFTDLTRNNLGSSFIHFKLTPEAEPTSEKKIQKRIRKTKTTKRK